MLAGEGQGVRSRRACQGGSGSVVCVGPACREACQEGGWFLPHNGGGVERKGGTVPPP